MSTISQVLAHNENILVIDHKNKLWILGDNGYGRCGLDHHISASYAPHYTGITMHNGESVKNFYVNGCILAIYTTAKRLFISKNSLDYLGKHNSPSNYIVNESDVEDEEEDEEERGDEVQEMMYEHGFMRRPDIEFGSESESESESDETHDLTADVIKEFEDEMRTQDKLKLAIEEMKHATATDSGSEETTSSDSDNLRFNTIDTATVNVAEHTAFNSNKSYISSLKKTKAKRGWADGMDLLADEVDDITFANDTIFFRKNEKIYMVHPFLSPSELVQKKIPAMFSTVVVDDGLYTYYQLILPFDANKVFFGKNFLYMRASNYHHIISEQRTDDCRFFYIYFQSDLDFDPKHIYYNPLANCHMSGNNVYIEHANDLYKYLYRTCGIEKVSQGPHMIFNTDDPDYQRMYFLKKNTLYVDENYPSKIIGTSRYFNQMVGIRPMNTKPHSSQLVLVDLAEIESGERFFKSSNILFVNIRGCDFYHLYPNGLVYCLDHKLYYLTSEDPIPNTTEINQIIIGSDTYRIFQEDNTPQPITNISFSSGLIVVQSNDRYFYRNVFPLDHFEVDTFTEILLNNHNMGSVIKSAIINHEIDFYDFIELTVNIRSSKFERLKNIIELLSKNVEFDITFVDNSKTLSYGDGAKREFMDSAISEFSQRFLIKHNVCTEFNLKEMESLSDDDLVIIGKLLHLVRCHTAEHLPIRLPLNLIAGIGDKEPEIEDLEFFAKMEDPDSFAILYKYKDDPDTIASFDCGTYSECLKFLSKYYHGEVLDEVDASIINKTKYISQKIGTSFRKYHEIKNLSVLNLPTLDYYLSGQNILDRELLVKNLKIYNEGGLNIDYDSLIIDFIMSMSEDKLGILLKNWSGSSVVMNSCKYQVRIVEKMKQMRDFHFSTCSVCITICESLVKTPETKALLLGLLTTPMATMIDF